MVQEVNGKAAHVPKLHFIKEHGGVDVNTF
jgi:hypothetical protein